MKAIKFRSSMLALLCVATLPLAASSTAAAAPMVPLYGESFRSGSTAADEWISGGDVSSEKACLTAASTTVTGSIPACVGGPFDSDGSGFLRLTKSGQFQSGFAMLNQEIPSGSGLDITFDMHQYGGNGADGISFFLVDGNASPTVPGAYGGSLGYASDTSAGLPGAPGVEGGYIGIGFDTFGNFSNPGYGTGGVGFKPNSIVVRGSEASGYKYVEGVTASGSLFGASRADSLRKVRVTITPENVLSVSVDYGSGFVTEIDKIDLNTVNGTTMPSSFKFGFAASTGNQYNMHEIRTLSVHALQPNVAISLAPAGDNSITPGSTKDFHLSVMNYLDAALAAGPIKATATFPIGITPQTAFGDRWSCVVSGQTVNCTSNDSIVPGDSLPVVTITTKVAAGAAGTYKPTASVEVENNANQDPTAKTSVIAAPGAVLGATTSSSALSAPNTGLAASSHIPYILSMIVAAVLGAGALLRRHVRQEN